MTMTWFSEKSNVGNGLCAVPQYRVAGFLTGLANAEIVDFDPLWAKIHGNGTQAVPYSALIRENRIDLTDFSQIHSRLDYFCLDRKESIDSLRDGLGVTQLHFAAADGYTNHMREALAQMDPETYGLYLRYHLSTCERADMVGISHHTIDIFRKD